MTVKKKLSRSETHLLHCPEGGLCLLVHPPDVGVLDGEDDEPSGVLSEQRFLLCLWPILAVWIFIFVATLQSKHVFTSCLVNISSTTVSLKGQSRPLRMRANPSCHPKQRACRIYTSNIRLNLLHYLYPFIATILTSANSLKHFNFIFWIVVISAHSH